MAFLSSSVAPSVAPPGAAEEAEAVADVVAVVGAPQYYYQEERVWGTKKYRILLAIGVAVGALLLLQHNVVPSSEFPSNRLKPRRHLAISAGLKLNGDPKSIEAKNEYSQLKFLFFGTSRSYGVFLNDPATESFPGLLSPHNGINLSTPGSNAHHPSRCVYSMMSLSPAIQENDAFDVIVLEFETFFPQVLLLAKRLRDRFPKARIIVIEMWLLRRFVHKSSDVDISTFAQNRIKDDVLSSNLMGMDKRAAEIVLDTTTPSDWEYRGGSYDEYKQQLKEMNVDVVKAPFPANAHTAVVNFGSLFLGDMHHFSLKGHKYLEHLILAHLRHSNFRHTHDATIAPWDDAARGQCEQWFRTGATEVQKDDNLVMHMFTPGKFALEARARDTWMKVVNLEIEPQRLVLEYMLAVPDCKYPDVEISIVGSSSPPAMLACPTQTLFTWQVNVVRDLLVGPVPPGESTVRIRVMQDRGYEWPFRVVGYSLGRIL